MSTIETIDLEHLLEHQTWARRLARTLVGESGADDLVQDTWLTAMRRPPRANTEGQLRAWLGTVLRNGARQGFRSEERRRHREERASRDEAMPSAAELTERTEAQRLLLDALLELAPERRQLVLLHFVDGLAAAEIARRLGLPDSTVKDRIAASLVELRGVLERRDPTGSGPGWSLALVPLLDARQVAPAAASLGLWSLIRLQLANPVVSLTSLAIVLLAAVVIGPLGEGPVVVEEAVVPSSNLVAKPGPIEVAIDPAMAREPIDPIGAGGAAVVDASKTRLRMRFVDLDGEPVEGVEVRFGGPQDEVARTSDGDGRIEGRVDPLAEGRQLPITWSHPNFANDGLRVTLAPGELADQGDVVLTPGGSVSGRVVDEKGKGIGGLLVSVEGIPGRRGVPGLSAQLGAARTRSAADGAFQLDGLVAGPVELVTEYDFAAPAAAPHQVLIQASAVLRDVEIRVDLSSRLGPIAGRVLDPDGEPVPRAKLELSWPSGGGRGFRTLSTDSEGAFQVTARHAGDHELELGPALARGWNGQVLRGVGPGTTDLVLRYVEPATFELRVVDDEGAPAPDAQVELLYFTGHTSGLEAMAEDYLLEIAHRLPVGPTEEPGLWRLPIPTKPFTVVASRDGYRNATLGLQGLDGGPEGLQGSVLTLQPAVVLRGKVLEGGSPVEGARLTLQRLSDGRSVRAGLPCFVEGQGTSVGTSDASGRFAVTLQEPGRFVLRIESPGSAPCELGPFDALAADEVEELSAKLVSGGVLRGRVSCEDGGTPAGRFVVASRGDAWPRVVRLNEDGSYRIENLLPGQWMVTIEDADPRFDRSGQSGGPQLPMPSNCTIEADKSTILDLEIPAVQRASLEGRFVLGDADLSGWTAMVQPQSSASGIVPDLAHRGGRSSAGTRRTLLDKDGSFALDGLEAGPFSLMLRRPGPGWMTTVVELELNPGTNHWHQELESGSVRLDTAGRAVLLNLVAHPAPGVVFRTNLEHPGGDVPAIFPWLPAGAAQLSHTPIPAGGRSKGKVSWSRVDLEVVAGTEIELELP